MLFSNLYTKVYPVRKNSFHNEICTNVWGCSVVSLTIQQDRIGDQHHPCRSHLWTLKITVIQIRYNTPLQQWIIKHQNNRVYALNAWGHRRRREQYQFCTWCAQCMWLSHNDLQQWWASPREANIWTNIFKEDLENTMDLFIDETRDMLHTSTMCKTTNGRLHDIYVVLV